MNETLAHRLAYLRIAFVGMLGYMLLEWLRTALHVSTVTAWATAGLISLAGLSWGARDFAAARRALRTARSMRSRVGASRAPTKGWRFDETESFVVGKDVLEFIPAARPVLERALLEIQEDPLDTPREVVEGEVAFVKRLQPPRTNGAVPGMLLGYKAVRRDRKIRQLVLARAADASSALAAGTYVALEHVMAVANRRARER
jgi:hypothetical protein